RTYRWRCTDRAIDPLARHDVRCAKGPSLLAISLIYSGICWQGKTADTPFATVTAEGQARGGWRPHRPPAHYGTPRPDLALRRARGASAILGRTRRSRAVSPRRGPALGIV